jgi:hypothetical protein
MREMEWGMGLYLASMDVITPKFSKMISTWWLSLPQCG